MTVPLKNLSGIVITVNKGSPATLSCPSMHPSFPGRERSKTCGSTLPLARAPNLRERALPPRLSNPARDFKNLALVVVLVAPHSEQELIHSRLSGQPSLHMPDSGD